MKCTDGNLLVTIAIVLGGLSLAAKALSTRVGTVSSGSGPMCQAGNWRSYFAIFGMPKVWWTSILSWRSATAIADRMAPVAYGPSSRSTLSTVISRS